MNDYLTSEDVQNYGSELLDVSQRAALHALAPHLQNLEQQNFELQRQLAREARHRLDQQIERALPDFRERDRDPGWHRWLLGIDELSGRVRQQLLNEAKAAGNADWVLSFFRSYQQESGGSQTSSAVPVRGQRSSGKQIYTGPMIRELYERHRKGEFTEARWNQIEADIFQAQHEGRVSAAPYLTK